MKRMGERKNLRYTAGAALCLALMMAAASGRQNELAEVRRATAWFHRVESAQAAHYHPMLGLDNCIEKPGVGAMGYHYFNTELLADVSPPDPLRPEGLVYAPGPDGKLQLAAVEYVVPADAWHEAGNTEAPTVMGRPMHILNPVLGWYILHAWVWQHNPAGMFEDWNPAVTCP